MEVTRFDDRFLKMKVDDAAIICTQLGLKWRIVKADNESMSIDDDYDSDRVNFHIENGIINMVYRG